MGKKKFWPVSDLDPNPRFGSGFESRDSNPDSNPDLNPYLDPDPDPNPKPTFVSDPQHCF
jgi:hypothetical protein